MSIIRDGQANLAGLTNPGVYVNIVPPTPFVAGVPTNLEAMIGVGSWGPVNRVTRFATPDEAFAIYGAAQIRFGDISSHVLAASQIGNVINYLGVRVTDGTDMAASATVQSTGGTATALYTGSLGNQVKLNFQRTSAAGAFAAVVNFPGRAPERFDNIFKGLQSLTVTSGTGYTSVPTMSLSGPQKAGGIQAIAKATLKAVSATVAAGGTGYQVADTVTLSNGVVLTVATVSGGAISTTTITNAGQISSGPAPTNPVAVTSTSGAGTGATFTLGWGLGTAVISQRGGGYTADPTVTLSGGGGTGGSYTAVSSFWGALAHAINLGSAQRGPSNYIRFAPDSSTADPTLNTFISLTGGTDGATGVATSHQIGSDVYPRTGMYALRGTGADSFALCDNTDSTAWAAQLAFAISETMLCVVTTPSGTSIADTVALRTTLGLDDTNLWLLVGDWPTFYDSANGSRLISPTAIAQGLLGNLSPEQSPINKPLGGISATQTSQTGVPTSDAEESLANTGGVDVIGRSQALGQIYFSFLTGRNASSNTASQGIEYTRMTSFIARSLNGAATKSIVGRLQSVGPDDPTRRRAKAILDSFFQDLRNPAFGSDGYGLIDDFATVCDETNNTPTTIARGYLFAFVKVRYLNVVRYFVIKLQGGGNVDIVVRENEPTLATVLALVG